MLCDSVLVRLAPDGREVPTRIRDVKGDQNYRIEWTPTMIGESKLTTVAVDTRHINFILTLLVDGTKKTA